MIYKEDGSGKYKLMWNWGFNPHIQNMSFLNYITFDNLENVDKFIKIYVSPRFDYMKQNNKGELYIVLKVY